MVGWWLAVFEVVLLGLMGEVVMSMVWVGWGPCSMGPGSAGVCQAALVLVMISSCHQQALEQQTPPSASINKPLADVDNLGPVGCITSIPRAARWFHLAQAKGISRPYPRRGSAQRPGLGAGSPRPRLRSGLITTKDGPPKPPKGAFKLARCHWRHPSHDGG